MSPETLEIFFKYFDDGMTPSAARGYHEIKLENGNDESEMCTLNGGFFREEHFGGREHSDVIAAFKKKQKLFAEMGIIVVTQENPLIVIVLTPIMMGAHTHLFHEIVFVDSSGSCDQTNSYVTFFFRATKVGAVPLACILHTEQSEENYTASFQLLRDTLPKYIADTEKEETYQEVFERCIRTALHLGRRNLSRDDVIVICSNNNQFSVVPFIASLFLNVPVASLDPTLSILDSTHLINEVKPKVIFVIQEVVDMIEASMQNAGVEAEVIVIGESDVYTEFSSFLEPHPDEKTFKPKHVDNIFDTAVIVFSSGTTGLPKGIMLSHYALMSQAAIIIHTNNINKIYLSYASLYWITRIIHLIATYKIGAANLMVSKFVPQECWRLLDKYKVTNVFFSPSDAIALIKAGRPENMDTSSLRTFTTSGASMPEEYCVVLRDLLPGTLVLQTYGQTEIAGCAIWIDVNNVKQTLCLRNKPKSVGMLLPNIMCKIVNVDTEETCGPNEQGELRLKTKTIMNGFYKRDCSESFDSNGWLKTGDIFYYDDDGCFYIVDRIKEMLKYKYWHVAPAMLEKILVNHPVVSQVVVIGKPHDEDGDHPMAVIIPNESYLGSIDEDDIVNFVEERVPDRMKLRGGIKFVSTFPMTPSGKIKRVLLKSMILNGEI